MAMMLNGPRSCPSSNCFKFDKTAKCLQVPVRPGPSVLHASRPSSISCPSPTVTNFKLRNRDCFSGLQASRPFHIVRHTGGTRLIKLVHIAFGKLFGPHTFQFPGHFAQRSSISLSLPLCTLRLSHVLHMTKFKS